MWQSSSSPEHSEDGNTAQRIWSLCIELGDISKFYFCHLTTSAMFSSVHIPWMTISEEDCSKHLQKKMQNRPRLLLPYCWGRGKANFGSDRILEAPGFICLVQEDAYHTLSPESPQLRETPLRQNGWTFRKVSNGPWPSPPFLEKQDAMINNPPTPLWKFSENS